MILKFCKFGTSLVTLIPLTLFSVVFLKKSLMPFTNTEIIRH